jgi:hypothetical protein
MTASKTEKIVIGILLILLIPFLLCLSVVALFEKLIKKI